MAQVCYTCGKKPSVGHRISHSNIKTLRRFRPNLQYKTVTDPRSGAAMKGRFCTRCLRTMVKPRRVRKARKALAAA